MEFEPTDPDNGIDPQLASRVFEKFFPHKIQKIVTQKLSNTFHILESSKTSFIEVGSIQTLWGNLAQEVRVLDTGLYIFVHPLLLLIDVQLISSLEPYELIDRIFIKSACRQYILKLFKYPFTLDKTKQGFTLGVTRQGHNSSAAIVNNNTGQVVAFQSEERPTRVKPARDFPIQSINDVLEIAGLKQEQISAVAVGHNIHWFEDTPSSKSPAHYCFGKLGKQFIKKDFSFRHRRVNILSRLQEALPELEPEKTPIFFIRHHIAHAASMPISCIDRDQETLFLVMDGRGEWDTITAWRLFDGDLKCVLQTDMPYSIGYLYNMMGRFMGWRRFGFEGQIMGLAPYGKPQNTEESEIYKYFRKIYEDFTQISPRSLQLSMNKTYFDGGYWPERLANIDGWVSPFVPSAHFLDLLSHFTEPMPPNVEIDPKNPKHRSICILAYVIQERTEQIIIELVKGLKKRYPKTKRLHLSGGVALNVRTNGKIISKKIFENTNLITTPVPGDDGLSIGGALYLSRFFNRTNSKIPYRSALLGREYKSSEIRKVLQDFGLQSGKYFQEYKDFEELIDVVIQLLEDGNGVAWFQGREEAGPRALGARSILYSLSNPKAHLQANTAKKRQYWRPAAISILQEEVSTLDYCVDAPYMSITFQPKPGYGKSLESGLHPASGSTRPQTVTLNDSPHLYKLLKRWRLKTGAGVLLNTSFNLAEPIVHRPDDALNTLYYLKGVNYLIMSNYFIRKGVFRPSIIDLNEDPLTKELFKHFKDAGEWTGLVEELLNYKVQSHQVHFLFNNKYTFPMFKEGFYLKTLKSILEPLWGYLQLPISAPVEIRPVNNPFESVLRRLLLQILER